MAPFRSGGRGFGFLDPDVESPRGCEPAHIRLPTVLDRDGRRGGGEHDHRLDPTGAVGARTTAVGRSGAPLGRRSPRICGRGDGGPRPGGGPALAVLTPRARSSRGAIPAPR